MEKKLMILIMVTLFSCSEKSNKDISLCNNNILKKLNIKGEINYINNNYEIHFTKPYKLLHESHQKLLTDFLVLCNSNLEGAELIKYSSYLVDDSKIFDIVYDKKDIDLLQKKYNDDKVLEEMHQYILANFNLQDYYGIEYALKKVFDSSKDYKLSNEEFLKLLSAFRIESINKNDIKSKLTLLITYGAYKNNEKEQFLNVSKHIKELWEISKNEDIEVSLAKIMK